jgi:succinate dehydrogenase (ubiquinone) membrane anchor subunit
MKTLPAEHLSAIRGRGGCGGELVNRRSIKLRFQSTLNHPQHQPLLRALRRETTQASANMASILKPAVLRQSLRLAPSKRLPIIASTPSRSFSLVKPRHISPTLTKAQPSSVVADVLRRIPQNTSFHSSAQRDILPPGPQVIHGSVNDPAPVPKPHPTHGSYHWTFERLISVGLIPLTIAPFAAGSISPVMDAILCATILIHSHMGFQYYLSSPSSNHQYADRTDRACIIDYLPKWQVPTTRWIAEWLLRIATIVVGVGFYEFETNDVGLTEAIKRIWRA